MAAFNSSRIIEPAIHTAIKVLIPSHPAAHEALALATSLLPQSILNHSLRTYLYAYQNLYSKHYPATTTQFDPSLGLSPVHVQFDAALRLSPHALFVAAILHDIGPTCTFDHIPGRFEVVGADEAVRILSAHDDDEAAVRAAWLAVALHAVPHVPERMGGCTAAFRLAIRRDFGSTSWEEKRPCRFGDLDAFGLGFAEQDKGAKHAGQEAFLAAGGRLDMDVETLLPRLDVEKVLGDEVVRQAMVNAAKAPRASWSGDLVRAKKEEPEWEGVSKGF